MQTIRLTKEFKFEMAHALKGYDGLCRNIHGHSYELLVTVTGIPVSDTASTKLGMVMDFGDLKKIVRKSIIDEFDHALVINRESKDDFNVDAEMFGRTILVDYQPTSENMLVDFVARLKNKMPANVKLHHLLLRETVTSYAEWFAEDNKL
ncbi:MAG: 6-carboxytetrahydropterin synthase [Lentimicrobiaceae bacterium]